MSFTLLTTGNNGAGMVCIASKKYVEVVWLVLSNQLVPICDHCKKYKSELDE